MKNQKISSYAFTAILVVLVTLIFIIIFSPAVTSSVVNSIPTYPPNTTSPGTAEILENPDYSQIEITKENVQSVIRAMARPTEYYYETKSTLFHSGGSKSYPRKKWTNGKLGRVDIISENGTTTMTVIYSPSSVYMWRPGQTRYDRTKPGDFTADTSQMMMVYEDVLELEAENILDAKYTIYNSLPCIYVEALSPLTGYKSHYWISADTGLLAFGQMSDSDNSVIYTVEAMQTVISVQDSSIFLLPDGNSIPAE